MEAIGEKAYLGAYSVVSFVTIGWMAWAYLRAPSLPLWQVPGVKLWPLVVMPFSLVLVAAGVMTRNPSAVGQARALKSGDPARGILRVTRHPVMWGIALWAAVHLAARGDVASLVFFGSFLVLALAGTRSSTRARPTPSGRTGRASPPSPRTCPSRRSSRGETASRRRKSGPSRSSWGSPLYGIVVAIHPWLFGVRATN